MKKIAVMQPYLFPYIGYFQLLYAVDTFVCFDDVHFIKKGWINRNNFLLDGESKPFTFPLSKISQNKLINEHHFADFETAKRDFLKFIEVSYRKSPQYQEIRSLLEGIFSVKYDKISDFIGHSLNKICIYLEIKTEVIHSSEIERESSSGAQERIINIVKKCGGDHYINAIGGRSLYDAAAFSKEKIKLSFIEKKSTEYKQYGETFVPNLSIIDALMFNTKQEMEHLLKQYELVSPS